jgi:hypothetical protein
LPSTPLTLKSPANVSPRKPLNLLLMEGLGPCSAYAFTTTLCCWRSLMTFFALHHHFPHLVGAIWCFGSPHAAGCLVLAVAWGLVGSRQPSVNTCASGPQGAGRWPESWPGSAVRLRPAVPCLLRCPLDCLGKPGDSPHSSPCRTLIIPWALDQLFCYIGVEITLCALTSAKLLC